jgi:hypothetical protein
MNKNERFQLIFKGLVHWYKTGDKSKLDLFELHSAFEYLVRYESLTRADVEMLASATAPCNLGKAIRAIKLRQSGLLESDPSAPHMFKCTALGEETVSAFRRKRWIP